VLVKNFSGEDPVIFCLLDPDPTPKIRKYPNNFVSCGSKILKISTQISRISLVYIKYGSDPHHCLKLWYFFWIDYEFFLGSKTMFAVSWKCIELHYIYYIYGHVSLCNNFCCYTIMRHFCTQAPSRVILSMHSLIFFSQTGFHVSRIFSIFVIQIFFRIVSWIFDVETNF